MRISDWSSDVCSSDLCGASESGLAGRDMAKPVNKSAQAWVSARHLQHVVIHGEAIGLRMDELLSVGGLDKGRLADPDGAVPIATFDAMLEAVADRYRAPLMGRSEENTSELQSLMRISSADFCLKQHNTT